MAQNRTLCHYECAKCGHAAGDSGVNSILAHFKNCKGTLPRGGLGSRAMARPGVGPPPVDQLHSRKAHPPYNVSKIEPVVVRALYSGPGTPLCWTCPLGRAGCRSASKPFLTAQALKNHLLRNHSKRMVTQGVCGACRLTMDSDLQLQNVRSHWKHCTVRKFTKNKRLATSCAAPPNFGVPSESLKLTGGRKLRSSSSMLQSTGAAVSTALNANNSALVSQKPVQAFPQLADFFLVSGAAVSKGRRPKPKVKWADGVGSGPRAGPVLAAPKGAPAGVDRSSSPPVPLVACPLKPIPSHQCDFFNTRLGPADLEGQKPQTIPYSPEVSKVLEKITMKAKLTDLEYLQIKLWLNPSAPLPKPNSPDPKNLLVHPLAKNTEKILRSESPQTKARPRKSKNKAVPSGPLPPISSNKPHQSLNTCTVAKTVRVAPPSSAPARAGKRCQTGGPAARASRGNEELPGSPEAHPLVQLQECAAPVGGVAEGVSQAAETGRSGAPKGMPELRDGLRALVARHSGGPLGDSEFTRFERDLRDWTSGASTLFGRGKKNTKGGRPRHNRGAEKRARANKIFQEKEGLGAGGGGSHSKRFREGAALRKEFWRNQKLTIKKVLGEATDTRCRVPLSDVKDTFTGRYSSPGGDPKPLPSWMGEAREATPLGTAQQDSGPIAAGEVENVLQSASVSSAPGRDGLTYGFWKALDPKGAILKELFEICRLSDHIPDPWRRSRVTLVCKDAEKDLEDIGNWRPISICETLYKLYAAVLARRITDFAVRNAVISPSQKGFMQCEGVFEHAFVLDQVIADSIRNKKKLAVAWLDIRDAFGSVRHQNLFQVLTHFRFPPDLIRAVQTIYAKSFCVVGTADGETSVIDILRGVRQGCPLSAILFNIVMEVLIRGLNSMEGSVVPVGGGKFASGGGYLLGGTGGLRVNNQGYADDMVIIAECLEALRAAFNVCEEFADWAGFQFHPGKSAIMARKNSAGRGAVPAPGSEPLRLGGVRVPILAQGRFYKYLGARAGHRLPFSDIGLVDKIKEQVRRLFASLLTPKQKIVALKRFILPRVTYHLRVRPFSQEHLVGLDRTIRESIRKSSRLPPSCCSAFIHTPSGKGGLGVPCMAKEANVMAITQAFRMLTAPDRLVSVVARASLTDRVARFSGGQAPPSLEELGNFLSGRPVRDRCGVSPGIRDIWTRARAAALDTGVSLSLEDTGALSMKTRAGDVSSLLQRSKVTRVLHAHLNQWWAARWASHPDQGKAFPVINSHCSNNAWAGERVKALQQGTVTFIHKARLNLLPTRSVRRRFFPGQAFDVTCRGCKLRDETLPHVLNHCPAAKPAYIRRHDELVESLGHVVSASGRFKKVDLDVTKSQNVNLIHLEMTGEVRKPDIVALGHDGTTTIIEVCCPFGSSVEQMNSAVSAKADKYKELCTNIADRTKKQVNFYVFAVSALGAHHHCNLEVLNAVGLYGKKREEFLRESITTVVRGSERVWYQWIKALPPGKERT